MAARKPRLAIVSSHNICCALAYYADALKEFLTPAFDVEILDLKTSHLLRQEGKNYQAMSEAYINQLCERLHEFDVVNVHLELGLFGATVELIIPRILKLCQASGRLILTVHTIDYKGVQSEHSHAYQRIIDALKKRPATNPFHLIVHLAHEKELMKKVFDLSNVTDFPLIYLTNERRDHFRQTRNRTLWKKQFGFKEEDMTIGVFGLLSAHKNYLHALRTLNLLPPHFKLLIIGEAHHMNIKERQVDPVVQEMISYLDDHPTLAGRVVFTGKREDSKYYEDLANVDFVLLPSFEVWQTGSATLSNALELGCATLKSNILNTRGYENYFPNCFEVFDVGNYYETKHKILHFDKTKLEKLNKIINSYSEVQLRQMYMDIYETMKISIPMSVSLPSTKEDKFPLAGLAYAVSAKPFIKQVFRRMPQPVQLWLRRLREKMFLFKN